jgi:hypothetical protein
VKTEETKKEPGSNGYLTSLFKSFAYVYLSCLIPKREMGDEMNAYLEEKCALCGAISKGKYEGKNNCSDSTYLMCFFFDYGLTGKEVMRSWWNKRAALPQDEYGKIMDMERLNLRGAPVYLKEDSAVSQVFGA